MTETNNVRLARMEEKQENFSTKLEELKIDMHTGFKEINVRLETIMNVPQRLTDAERDIKKLQNSKTVAKWLYGISITASVIINLYALFQFLER